jgi:DNA-binding SARP family transcriptional activator
MEEQLSLQGFELFRLSQVDELSHRRRRSDPGGEDMERLNSIEPYPVPDSDGQAKPVRIYTLGRFSLLYQGQPIGFGRKTPQRALTFLKTLIALGGREVSSITLAAALWPDADGDTAQRSFDTTLYRLRKLFAEDQILILRDGMLSLDARKCWVDVWAFDRLLGHIQRVRSKDVTGQDAYKLEQLSGRMLSLYQGHFLAKEEATSWSVSLRERLRSKYIHNLLELGQYWEIHGFWDKAMVCYQKGLEVDDLIEVFYQRLMLCCLETQRISEGMSVYRRCRQVLSIVLGLQPEPETDSIHQTLRNARLHKRFA